jgi:hypothetical protein
LPERNLRRLAQLDPTGSSRPKRDIKDDAVKKIALTMVAVATFGLAACGSETAHNSAANGVETTNAAVSDVDNASANQNAANDALNTIGAAGSDVIDATGNVAGAVGNATVGAGRDVGNAVGNAAR